MAGKHKQKKKAVEQSGRGTKPRQAPKIKVIESGKAEQGAPIKAAALSDRDVSQRQAARAKEREEYRYGGIPIGSDPRE